MFIFSRILAVLILLLIIMFALAGFPGSAQSSFTITEHIKSPVTVVWQTMINPDKIAEWNENISYAQISSDGGFKSGTEIITYFKSNPKEILERQKLVKFQSDQQLVFQTMTGKKKSLLKKLEKDYRFKSLLDGSVEISLTISYEPAGFIARAMDRLYIHSQMVNRYSEQLMWLKKYIEKL